MPVADQAIIDHLLDAISDETQASEVSRILLTLVRIQETSEGVALLWAFCQQQRLGDADSLLLPLWESRSGDGKLELPPEHREALLLAASSSRASAFVRGHLGSLLWSTSPGRDVLAIADDGIDGLLEVGADSTIDQIERYGHLVAAVDLANHRKDLVRRDRGLHAMLVLADEVLELGPDDQQPGTLMLDIGHYLLLGGDAEQAAARLRTAITALSGYSHARQQIAGMLAGLSDSPETRGQIAADEVTRLIADAESLPGFLKENTLSRALTLARQNGLRKQAGRVSTLLAAISPEDYDFKVSTFGYECSGDQVRELLAPYQPEKDIRQGFLSLGSLFPGFLPALERPVRPPSVADLIATPAVISSHGHVEYAPTNDTQRLAYRNRQEDMMEFKIQYDFIYQAVQDMLARPDALASFRDAANRSPLLTDKGKSRANKAIDSYLAEDWDGVSDTLPTIENAIRTLCLASGINIYSPAGGANEFKTLGGLLVDLATSPEPDVRRFAEYWRFALTDSLGLNIRNDYLHGLDENASQMTATVIMQIYMQLVFFIREGSPPE